MVFPLKTISSDCRFYLPGFFCFVSLLLFFVPAHHNHFTTITFYSESFTLRLLHRRTRFRIGGSIGSQRPRGQILERFGRIFFFVLLSLVERAPFAVSKAGDPPSYIRIIPRKN